MIRSFIRSCSQLGTKILWDPYSRLFVVDDGADWSLSWDARELRKHAERRSVALPSARLYSLCREQCLFHVDRTAILDDRTFDYGHRIGLNYYHGFPGTGELFDRCYQAVLSHRDSIYVIRVSNNRMRDCLTDGGFPSERIHLIPIAIPDDMFRAPGSEERTHARNKFNIPEGAFVVGSFQKDGNGWEEGLEPKLIKGPDTFLETMERVRVEVPELFVLLSGPARGYVKAGLERLGIPYAHHFLENYPAIQEMFWALDAYLISSRQEGGPKAVLESMACGVPLVTTRVGQAEDLVHDGVNAFMRDVEDADGLAAALIRVRGEADTVTTLQEKGLKTADQNTEGRQNPLWDSLLESFMGKV